MVLTLVFFEPLVFAQTPNDFKIDLTGENDGIIITGYTGTAEKVVIPSEIEGMPVRGIGTNAFFNKNVIELTIPDSVTTIGNRAFYGCVNLISIVIPHGVTTIGNRAFYDCRSLASVTIPDSVATIGAESFSGCRSLISIVIPDGVTTIESNAFFYCISLASVTIPDSVTTIERRAFYSCRSLTSVILAEDAQIDFGSYEVFNDCPKIDARSQIALRKAGYTGSF